MTKLMFVVFAVISSAVLAQEKGTAKPDRRAPFGLRDHTPMTADRGFLPQMRGGFGGIEMMSDPAVMAAMNPKVLDKLGVSDEVKEQIRKGESESRDQLRSIQVKGRELQERHMTLMKADKPDEAAVMAVIDEVFELRKEMAKILTRRVLRVKSLLSPEQLAKASETLKMMRGERRTQHLKGSKAESAAKSAEGNTKEAAPVKDAASAAK